MIISMVVYVILAITGLLGSAIAWDDLTKAVEKKDADKATTSK